MKHCIKIKFKIRNSADARKGWFSLKHLKSSFIWEIRTLAITGKKNDPNLALPEVNSANVSLLGITMVVAVFDARAALAVGAVIATFILVTDTIFSVIVTYIFLKPMLEVLKVTGGLGVHTAESRRLERTKRWNFAGVLVTVGGSTVLYVNLIVYFALTFFRQYSLHSSAWGNPFSFGLALDSILKTLGMILLCGMFKDVDVPHEIRRSFLRLAAQSYAINCRSTIYSYQ